MASLQNTQITGNSYLTLPSGNTSQRPAVGAGGIIRYNTDTNLVEFAIGTAPGATGQDGTYAILANNGDIRAGVMQVNTTVSGSSSQTNWMPMSIPYKFRQIINYGYVLGGYQNSTVWTDVNQVTASTDTVSDVGNVLDRGFNYKAGACNWYRAYAFGAGNAHAVNSNITTGFNMATNTAHTAQSRSNMANARGHMGTIFQEQLLAWVSGGENATIEEFDLTVEMFRTFSSYSNAITGITGDSGATSGGPRGMSTETFGILYTGEGASTVAQQTFTFATKTNAARSGTQAGVHYQQKEVNTKGASGYAGNEGSWSGGYTFRRTTFSTNSTVSTGISKGAGGNYGEENWTLGQDWGYLLGQYNGAQNNITGKWTYATETMSQPGSLTLLGPAGRSSGVGAWKN